MLSAPNKENKPIPHIDGRDIKDIELEIAQLKDKLAYDIECIKIKKHTLHEKRLKKAKDDITQKQRKTFAFKIVIDRMLTPTEQQSIFNQLKTLIEKDKTKISKIFMLNNFVYIKTNLNLKIPMDKLPTDFGIMLEQINPKDILKLQ